MGSWMKFAPLVYKLESMVYAYTFTNFTEILPGTHGDVALSGRIKLLLSFSSPLIHVPALSPVSGARILIDLHLMISGF